MVRGVIGNNRAKVTPVTQNRSRRVIMNAAQVEALEAMVLTDPGLSLNVARLFSSLAPDYLTKR